MKLFRFAATSSAILLSAALALTGAGAVHAAEQAPAATGYVALGDSYSSGTGAGNYGSSGSCKRSTVSYPALWAAQNGPSSFDFTACSGARTGDVLANQLGPLSSSTGLVSISIGGNDAGFADVMQTCVLSGEDTCLARVDEARAYVANTLPGQLDSVYDAISSRAPSAHVVAMGYPRLYQLDGTCIAGLSEAERAALNGASDTINAAVSARASAHGFSFGDVSSAFNGHQICSSDSWLHSVTLPVDESYHPTAAGHSGAYLPVFSSRA